MERPPDLKYFMGVMDAVKKADDLRGQGGDVFNLQALNAMDYNLKLILYQHMNMRKDEWSFFLEDEELKLLNETFRPFSSMMGPRC